MEPREKEELNREQAQWESPQPDESPSPPREPQPLGSTPEELRRQIALWSSECESTRAATISLRLNILNSRSAIHEGQEAASGLRFGIGDAVQCLTEDGWVNGWVAMMRPSAQERNAGDLDLTDIVHVPVRAHSPHCIAPMRRTLTCVPCASAPGCGCAAGAGRASRVRTH